MPSEVVFKNPPGSNVSPSFNALPKGTVQDSFSDRDFLSSDIPN